MKKFVIIVGFLLCLATSGTAADFPWQIGEFRLGADISSIAHLFQKGTAYPVRHREYLIQVETDVPAEFKSGLITYSKCSAEPGRIVQIKLKYADNSMKFYKELLKRFKARYGEPDQWRGDPFHIVTAWKWSVKDDAGNRCSMTLQNNTKDESEKIGNSLKITLWSLVDQEIACFLKKHPEIVAAEKSKPISHPNWDLLIPGP